MDGQKQTFLQKLAMTRPYQFLRNNRGVRYFIIALTVLVATGVSVLGYIWSQPEPSLSTIYPVTIKKPEPKKYYSPLTGVEVANEATTKRAVTAIMIENSPDARPQSGLKDAGVVFEAVAEGGITRFVALYQESRPGLIGPVRSVRPYYVEWAAGFDVSMAHVGGSARALDMIRSGSYGIDLDQFSNSGSYWRSTDRYAPHNVYTNFDKIDALNTAKGKTTSSFTFSPRVDGKKVATPTATNITIDVSSGYYGVHYDYDVSTNTYVRRVGGENHLDREGGQLQPNVVIAMRVGVIQGFEDGYREQITTTGKGQAYIFQNGTVEEATWNKADARGRLSFVDANGKEISLNRGQTWITALASEKNVSWK